MTRKPGRAAAMLGGVAERLAGLLVESLAALEAAPRPTSDIEIERRARTCGVIARSMLAIRKAEDHDNRPDGPRDEDDMHDADDAGDAEVLERKCAALRALLDRYGERMERRAAERAAQRPEGDDRRQLAPACERRAA
ncbi:MAG: hypothetical protein ACOY4K_15530 [Pseudomonadota bacterium]